MFKLVFDKFNEIKGKRTTSPLPWNPRLKVSSDDI